MPRSLTIWSIRCFVLISRHLLLTVSTDIRAYAPGTVMPNAPQPAAHSPISDNRLSKVREAGRLHKSDLFYR